MKATNQTLLLLATLAGSLIPVDADGIDVNLNIRKAVRVDFQAEQGKIYQIESSPEAVPPNWTTEGRTIQGVGATHQATFLTEENQKRIFRVSEIDLLTGLAGYYPFNGNSNDESGVANDGTWVGGANLTNNRFGQAQRALSLPSRGSYLRTSTANGFPRGTNDFTFSGWIRATARIDNEHAIIFSNLARGQFQLDLWWKENGKSELHFHTGPQDNPPDCASSELNWELNRWYNVQIVRAKNQIRAYLDGVLVGQGTTTDGNDAPADARRLDFGYRTADGQHQLTGDIDDFRIYNRALRDSEIKALREITE